MPRGPSIRGRSVHRHPGPGPVPAALIGLFVCLRGYMIRAQLAHPDVARDFQTTRILLRVHAAQERSREERRKGSRGCDVEFRATHMG